MQLPGLTSLLLDMRDAADDPWAGDDIAWRAIARMPNLSQLTVSFCRNTDDYNRAWFYMSDLTALQPLGSKLQQLDITGPWLDLNFDHDYHFLSSLTGGAHMGYV
jgi:hypothetical protein